MSTGFFLTAIIDGCVCLALFAISTKCLRKRFGLDNGSCLGCLISILLLPLLVMGTYPLVMRFGTGTGDNLTVNEARSAGLTLQMPKAAKNICFMQHFNQIVNVDFDVNEQGFLDWAHSLGMDPRPISEEPKDVWPLQKTQNDSPVQVTRGYYFDRSGNDEHPDNAFPLKSVVYDKASNRAYYRYSTY